MKNFITFRTHLEEAKKSIADHGKVVKKFTVGKNKVVIQKDDAGKFHAHIDGEMLDKYKSQAEAEKMAKEFINQLG